MKETRVIGKMTFPHYVKAQSAERKSVKTKVKQINPNTKRLEDMEVMVNQLSSGTIDMIADPSAPIVEGDVLVNPFYKNIVYLVNKIIEQRPAKGDWSFVSFTPIFQRCEIVMG